MKCLTCEAPTHVVETRPYQGVFTRRMHECFNGHRFITVEVPPGAVGLRELVASRRGVALRKKAYQLRRAVDRRPDMNAEAVGRELGVSGARVRQIRKEQNART